MAKGRAALLAGCLLLAGCVAVSGGRSMTYRADDTVFQNPLIGYAPGVRDAHTEGTTLRYLGLSWREVEPEEEQFAWETLEQTYGLSELRRQGVHLVLRFFCDEPGREAHLDIPDWLYAKTGDGSWYENDYGSGYSPNYANAELLAAHETALRALGEFLGGDGFVSYVELGSLGHWGEWHVNYSAGIQRLPLENVREEYITPWINAFPDAIFLMRRPFSHADKYGMGLYNDMAGEPNETRAWLNEIENAGYLSQTEEENGLSSMTDFWKSAPVGGEFTSSLSMEDMLSTNLSQTVQLIQESHTTFLGPNTANSKYLKGYQTILKNMGYRIWISKATLSSKLNGTRLKLTWENNGAAPFYKDWPVWVYITDENGNILQKEQIELNLSSLLPGEIIQTDTQLDIKVPLKLIGEKYHISVGVEDPMTGKDSIRFAMQCDFKDGENYLW